MVMMGLEFTGQVPFSTIYLHGLVGSLLAYTPFLALHSSVHCLFLGVIACSEAYLHGSPDCASASTAFGHWPLVVMMHEVNTVQE